MKFFSLILASVLWMPVLSGCKSVETTIGIRVDSQYPREDFRGVWLASIGNLDWPVSNEQTVEEQKADAVAILDSLKGIGINAVLFQVRAESDALYASSYDPWSFWLTGEQGRAPDPFYDPLFFMVREAHKRGMELHAWLNPFRVERKKGQYDLAGNNVSLREPGWILEFESRPGEYYTMLNPGLPGVRDYVTNVVVDIIRRYDVDGIHFDDYFYPASPVSNEDSLAWRAYDNDTGDIGDWRRDNINRLMAQIHDSLQALAPHVSYGISPFPIRKNDDAGTNGLESYYTLYADGQAWLEAQSIDYINPQLYFEIGNDQADYASMLAYWTEAAYNNRRYIYAGLSPYKLLPPHDWTLEQAVSQLRMNVEHPFLQGNIYFRTEHLLSNPKGYTDVLRDELYRYPALTPSMPWKNQEAPMQIDRLAASWSGDGRVVLTWADRETGNETSNTARYAVYRLVDSFEQYEKVLEAGALADAGLRKAILQARNMADVTGPKQFVDHWPDHRGEAIYIVTAVSRNSIESEPAAIRAVREGDVFSYHAL
ncbi:MAG: family 10 glycosylhydrolase [Balneolales bacterium]